MTRRAHVVLPAAPSSDGTDRDAACTSAATRSRPDGKAIFYVSTTTTGYDGDASLQTNPRRRPPATPRPRSRAACHDAMDANAFRDRFVFRVQPVVELFPRRQSSRRTSRRPPTCTSSTSIRAWTYCSATNGGDHICKSSCPTTRRLPGHRWWHADAATTPVQTLYLGQARRDRRAGDHHDAHVAFLPTIDNKTSSVLKTSGGIFTWDAVAKR